jgi:hypothetical protein
MRRKRLSRNAAETAHGPRRRRDKDVPAVPTFKPEIQTIAVQAPPATTEDDAAQEAVRRMVEAAYT